MSGPLTGVRVLDCTTVVAYSKTPGAIRRLPPRLGEHSAEILREAGFRTDEIDALLASGATRRTVSQIVPQ